MIAAKERIVGSIVLGIVALTIMFMIANSPADNDQSPQSSEQRIQPLVLPVAEAVPVADVVPNTQPEVLPVSNPQSELVATLPIIKPRHLATYTHKSVKPHHVTIATPKPLHKVVAGWMVQLGNFQSDKNAKMLEKKLQRMGYAVYIEREKLKIGVLHKVLVGPFTKQQAANLAVAKLQKSTHLKPVVVAMNKR